MTGKTYSVKPLKRSEEMKVVAVFDVQEEAFYIPPEAYFFLMVQRQGRCRQGKNRGPDSL